MKMRTSLMLLAAALVPAYAAGTPMAELVSKLSATQSPAPAASPAQLARLYPALAQLPLGPSEYLTLNLEALEALGAAEAVPFDCLALGSRSAKPAFYAALNKVISSIQAQASPASTMAMGKDAPPAPLDPAMEAELNLALTELSKQNMEPVYLTLHARKGQEEQVAASVMAAVHNPFFSPAETLPEGVIAGGKLNWDALLAGREITPETKDHLQKRPIYLMAYSKGRAFTLVICEKPEAIALPGTAAGSVLNTAAGKAIRAGRAGQKPLAALHLSAKFMQAMQKASWGEMADDATELAKGHTEAAESAALLQQFCRTRANARVMHPTTLQVWTDARGMSATGTMDAQGRSYKPGKYRIMPLANVSSTMFYMESMPMVSPDKSIGFAKLIKAVAELYAASANSPQEAEGMEGPSVNMTVNPMAVAMVAEGASALETVMNGLSGHFAIVVDGKGKAPAFLGGAEAEDFPRLGVYAGISKRELLSKGWGQVETLLAQMGTPKDELPIETKKAGKATRYSIAHPMFDKSFMPNLMLVGNHMVFGTTPSLNVGLLKAAANSKSHVPGEGTVFLFRPKVLAGSMKSMTPATPEPVVAFGEQAEAEAAMSAASTDMAGSAAEALADKVEQLYGITTVEEGVYTLKLRVDYTAEPAE